MAEHNANQDSKISDSLHPLVNMAIIGLVLMFVAAVWMFFDSGPYEAWLDDSHLSFRDWAVGDFDTLTGPVKGANATVEVLLPIAAVAVGMTVLGLVFHIIASGAA